MTMRGAWIARAGVVAAMIVALKYASAAASPFVPSDDAQVLERLPVSPGDPSARRLQELRRELTQQPSNLALATRVAWRYIEQGRTLSDPRYYGYAQAALTSWWSAPEPPAPILVLRATIRQHNHEFEPALADLSLALQQDADNAQAWLTRALILQVRGEYADARRSCLEVLQRSSALVAAICVAGVDSLSGHAAQSYDMLRGALDRAHDVDANTRVWSLTVLGEIAARLGRASAAEQHFTAALSLGVRDDYLLGAYADFLLDQSRSNAVVALLANETRADALLLRLTIAEKQLGSPAFAGHVDALRARFAAARLRGEAVHGREEARFALECLAEPRAALDLARANWAVQHETWDARLLLASAIAAGEPAAAQPAIDFVNQAGLEDIHVQQLTEGARGARS